LNAIFGIQILLGGSKIPRLFHFGFYEGVTLDKGFEKRVRKVRLRGKGGLDRIL